MGVSRRLFILACKVWKTKIKLNFFILKDVQIYFKKYI
ncbi:hypothetical protein FCR2A7T_20720 [Flavobacterium cauense R2A-7]|nr:hypothetical protein FCR2A7T_20720 [Flavobacterium cauense R2A-7]